MNTRASACAVTFLLMASCAAIACDSDDDPADASLTGPRAAAVVVGSVTVAPTIKSVALTTSPTCFEETPFDVGLNVNVRARQEVFIRGIDFEFFDLSRRRVLPLAFPGTIQVNDSVLLPVPLPPTHPIPFPEQSSLSNVIVPAGGTFMAPFRLHFECGVSAHGTLFVAVTAADRRGTLDVSRASARIGE